MKFSIFQDSRQGTRPINQDRIGYCYSRDALFMIVADGMGGHPYGEVAAQVAVTFFGEAFQREAVSRLPDPCRFLRTGMVDAHHAIGVQARARGLCEAPRTTCVACVVQGGVAHWAHVGDSRLYHLHDTRVEAVTRDHSQVQRLLDTGRIRAEAASGHPERNRLYSCLGGPEPPLVALSRGAKLSGGDVLLLCTDGVWGPLNAGMISATLANSDIMQSVPQLLDLARMRAGRECDNLSAIAMTWLG